MKARYALIIPLLAVVAACAAESMPEPAEGAALFSENCVGCHGTDAHGRKLATGTVAPDLTKISARNGGVFPKAAVMSQIDGFARGNHPGEVMPEFGEWLKGDLIPVEVDGVLTPTPRPLAALATYLESIQVE